MVSGTFRWIALIVIGVVALLIALMLITGNKENISTMLSTSMGMLFR